MQTHFLTTLYKPYSKIIITFEKTNSEFNRLKYYVFWLYSLCIIYFKDFNNYKIIQYSFILNTEYFNNKIVIK